MNEIQKNQSSDFIIHNYEDAPDVLKQVENIDDKIVDYYLALNKKKEVENELFNAQQLHKNIYTF